MAALADLGAEGLAAIQSITDCKVAALGIVARRQQQGLLVMPAERPATNGGGAGESGEAEAEKVSSLHDQSVSVAIVGVKTQLNAEGFGQLGFMQAV